MERFQLVNSKKRVVFRVTDGPDGHGNYSYRFDGGRGYGPAGAVIRSAVATVLDNPSAKCEPLVELVTEYGPISFRDEWDEKDAEILRERAEAFAACDGPLSGDYVRFADGVERRVSHVWRDDWGDPTDVQTSDGGRWYLGLGYGSFSGALFPPRPFASFRRLPEWKAGAFWFFHRDHWRAGNDVDVLIPCRVWESSVDAP
jgi:hypothetical protein